MLISKLEKIKSKYFTLLSLFDTFMKNLLLLETKRNNNYLLNWIEKHQSWGKYSFSLEQVKNDFLEISEQALILALTRLSKKGRILSVYKGFYLIIPPEYASRGILPSLLFINYLMEFTGKPYYIGLLSAAALHGAAHQQPQESFVITTSKQNTTLKKGLKINYIKKKSIPDSFIDKRKTDSGYVNVSNPELTAADLIYYDNRIGGINRAASVINELAEVMDPERITGEYLETLTVPTIQRLGYILDAVLDQKLLADKLYSESQSKKIVFFRQPLKAGKEKACCSTNNRWKIIINTEMEIDE